jgi:hypothetical protein
MGYTHCFRANAAYSLYGVLKGNNDNGCSSGAYINSFFTNYGVDVFEPVMEAAGVFSEDDEDSYTAECAEGDDDDDDSGDDAYGGGYGGGTSYANKGDNLGSISYGMSCDGNQFVTKKFRGTVCDGKDEIEVTDLLESFNEAIVQVDCVEVYSAANDEDDEIASELLSYSSACSLREFPSLCPDPYGKLLRYTRALECSTGAKCLLTLPETQLGRDIASIVLLLSGIAMIGATLCCNWRRRRGKSRMDFIRESSDLSNVSKQGSAALSKASSSISQASAMVVEKIQNFAEAESPQSAGTTVQMQMVSSSVTRSRSVSSSPSAGQAEASNVSTPGSTRSGLVPAASEGQSSVGLNEAPETPTPNGASMPSAAEAIDSTPSTIATLQSIKSAEDRKMAATTEPPTYGPPSTRSARSTSTDDEAIAHTRIDEEVANNMLADKEMEQQTSYKRPALARMSKRLFGGRKRKVNKKFEY